MMGKNMMYDKYNRNKMYYMINDINDNILLQVLYNTTKEELLKKMQNIINPNFQDLQGNSYLHLACLRHSIEATEILLKIGANPNIKNNDGVIPIFFATIFPENMSNLKILDLMLQFGLDLNYRFNGKTVKEKFDEYKKYTDMYDLVIKKYIS